MSRYRRRPIGAAFVLATVAAVAIAGCSTTNKTGPATATGSSGPATVAVGNSGPVSALVAMDSVCGSKPIKVGLVDGYGTNSWSKIVRAEVEDEAKKCPAVSSIDYVAGRGDLQATLAGITSLTSKGVNVLLVVADAGPGASHLSALRSAAKNGVTVIPIASDPTGKAGSDYFDYVDWDTGHSGEVWATWMVARLGSKGGNIVLLGGPAGNAVSTAELAGIKKVLAGAPQVKLLTEDPVTTNWDPAMEQQAMSGLLAKYSQIDGIISDYGAAATGAIRAYQSAGRPLVPIATTDDNELSCGFAALKASNSGYELATVSSRTWIGRVGLRKGVALANGKADAEPSLLQLDLYEDSAAGTSGASGAIAPAKACRPSLPNDAPPSSQLTVAQLGALFAG